MKRIISLLAAAAMLFSLMVINPNAAYAAADYSTIKVKLTTNNATVLSMSVKGNYFLNENGAEFSGGTLTLRANFGGTLTVSHSKLGELYTGETVSIMREKMEPSAGYMYFNSRSYLGHFNVKVLSNGFLQVVNVVPLAHYLYGVVGHEMSNSFPIEALKAQAVAAKCYVLSNMKTGSAEYYLGDTSSDQVYKGYTASNKNVIEAVDSTLTEILTVNGNMLCTYYAASNGGETNLVTYAWSTGKGTDAGFGISIDEYDFANKLSPLETVRIPINRTGSISRELYDMLLAKASVEIGVTATGLELIDSVELHTPRHKNVTRNMTRMKVKMGVIADGALYDNIEIDFNVSDLYTYGVVSNATLRTYWGEYDAAQGEYVIYHARWGHGVGMSQRGAQQRANDGWNYKEILSFYYPGAKFSTISVSEMKDPLKPGATPDPNVLPQIGTAVVTGNVRFRKGPGSDYDYWGTIKKDSEVPVYGVENGWYRIILDDMDGYVSGSYLDVTITATPAPTPVPTPTSTPSATPVPGAPTEGVTPNDSTAKVIGTGSINAQDVNFRTGPAVSYSRIKKLAKGTELTAYTLTDGWYYVNIDGVYGYVIEQYVNIEETVQQPEATPEPEKTPVAAYRAKAGTVTRSAVNFREAASTASARLRQLDKNTAVYVLLQDGDYYKAVVDGQFGYIYTEYVSLTGEEVSLDLNGKPVTEADKETEEEAPAAPTTGKGVTSGNVNFRKGPGTSHESMGTLKKGVNLTLIALENGWYKVKVGGEEGYISSKYVTVTEDIPEAAPPETDGGTAETPELTVPKILGIGETTGSVNFREGPSTSSDKIGKIKKGQPITLYSLADGWYEVDYNGTRGYLYAKYVKVVAEVTETPSEGVTPGVTPEGGTGAEGSTGSESTAPGNTENTGVQLAQGTAVGTVNFRDRPSTTNGSVVGKLKAGDTLSILGETDEWYYAVYNGRVGFAYKAYIKVTNSGSQGIAKVSESVTPILTSTTAEVNLRKGMSTSSEVIRLLPNHSAVTVYMIFDGWCFLSSGGSFGFAVTDYVKLG